MKITIKDKILIIEADDRIDRQLVKQLKEDFEKSTGNKYPVVLWRNTLGYYSAYDFDNSCSIYCGTRSEKTSMEQIKKYINGKI
jgi:hypothetical protein